MSADVETAVLTAKELAKRWSISEKTLEAWRGSGKGPKFLKVGDGERPRVRYEIEDIVEYERTHTVEPRL